MPNYTIIERSVATQTFNPGLYIVSTPIGNLADISFRALATLEKADLVVCEDTRVTGALLKMLGLKKPLLCYHDHNGERQRPKIIQELQKNHLVALVSDAGTPLISDPGYKLVLECQQLGIHVTGVPGPVAFIDALVLSGLPTDRFFFGGFLPHKGAKKVLESYAAFPFVLIFYEAPSRLKKNLKIIEEVFGNPWVVVGRELTKKFEQLLKGPASEVLNHLENISVKGEFVIIIHPPSPKKESQDFTPLYKETLQKFSLKEGAEYLSKKLGQPKRAVYQQLLEIKSSQGEKPL